LVLKNPGSPGFFRFWFHAVLAANFRAIRHRFEAHRLRGDGISPVAT
jgi:hypothetical protein